VLFDAVRHHREDQSNAVVSTFFHVSSGLNAVMRSATRAVSVIKRPRYGMVDAPGCYERAGGTDTERTVTTSSGAL
jgi:hypothetical protein